MGTKKLLVEYSFDFELLGLTSSAKEHKLAWAINSSLETELTKQEEIIMELKNGKTANLVYFLHETENSILTLIKNKMFDSSDNQPKFLIPELKTMDYFIRIDGDLYPLTTEKIIEQLKNINTIEYISKFKIDTLKSKENLLFY
ncbi:MAG: IPExxxVDY family protein [Cyclobacteriaceae bacterium]|nr:IPExxxVDY family protein [Cyclobacteriaceae bacterium]